jgi:DNA-binding transcriptional MerR regulator
MKKYLSISEMASMHNVSRQALIYYDKIDLFKPDYIDEHGYRYYTPYQIPYLREICLLKSAGIKLENIKSHIENRSVDTVTTLLEYQKKVIDDEINELLKKRDFIDLRLNTYSNINSYKNEIYKPFIKRFPERKMIFCPMKIKYPEKNYTLIWLKPGICLFRMEYFFMVDSEL